MKILKDKLMRNIIGAFIIRNCVGTQVRKAVG